VTVAPADARITLTAGDDRAVVDADAGARLASLFAGGAERLLTTPPAGADGPQFLWGCFVMAPWAGRLGAGRLPLAGRTLQLATGATGHALHGLVYDTAWTVVEATSDAAVLRCPLAGRGWELGGSVTHELRLAPGRLELGLTVEAAEHGFPAAAGWHPWFRRPEPGDLVVRVDADEVLRTTSDLVPTGEREPVSGATDLRSGPELGERRLDHPFPDVRSPAIVGWPDLELRMDFTDPVGTVVVYTPANAVCVEPQTAWPNAPALAAAGVPGTGVVDLAPGQSLVARVTWTWRGR
jgi:galactose mutarotase-like enzyme